MDVLLVTHPAFRDHDAGAWHPERPARLKAVEAGVRAAPVTVVELQAPEVDEALLATVHDVDYIDAIRRFCRSGGGELDPDTFVSRHSWEAALRSAGAGPAAVHALRMGMGEVAMLAIRPPGHHALANRAMGFCLFNNIAVTARALTAESERVAIVDWDVHHGNGTQEVFDADPRVLYLSLHQFPFYPGSGWVDEVGYGPGAGTVLNFPLPAHAAGDVYREAFVSVIAPVLRQFRPDWILVSAGYDAHAADPLAEMRLLASDYGVMAKVLAGEASPGRVIYFLEGGYDLEAMRDSVTATLVGAGGGETPSEPQHPGSDVRAWRMLELAAATAGRHWDLP